MKLSSLILLGFLALSSLAFANKKPNILWITSEDNNVTFLGCYGNKYAVTPNLDKLADNGFRFTQCYSNGAVCSASRSSWITGMLSNSTGLLNHRSSKKIPTSLVLYPKAIHAAGYYTANWWKMDYNIENYDKENTWDSYKFKWSELKEHQPFFQVVNLIESHESRAMSTDYKSHDPKKVILPPYHPDDPTIRANYAYYYEHVTLMDTHVGKILKELEESGMKDDTIVIYCSDHGGPLPRGKRYLYNSGTHSPLIISIPEKFKNLWPAEKPGMPVDRLVGFIDMIPTWIDLAGGKAPSNYQGSIFLGKNAAPERHYNYSFRGRSDERIENVRSIRTKRFLYVKNYIPYVPRGQHLDYQWKIPIQQEWEKLYLSGKTNAIQSRYFKMKHEDEFYDTEKDPYCINNLVQNPEYKTMVQQFKAQLQAYQKEIYDVGFLPESELDKMAADNDTTIYELVRNKKFYNLDRYIDIADLALKNDSANVNQLAEYLKDKDTAVRYWGAVGLMMLGKDALPAKQQLLSTLNDPSHNVRLMAAWALIKLGEQKAGHDAIVKLLQSESYASLEILNVIAWMGEDGKQFIPALKAMKNYEVCVSPANNFLVKQLRDDLVYGFDRHKTKKKGKKKKKAKK